jgi:hypothetical protein
MQNDAQLWLSKNRFGPVNHEHFKVMTLTSTIQQDVTEFE